MADRKTPGRYYIDGMQVVLRVKGKEDVRFDFSSLSEGVRDRLAMEGFIALDIRTSEGHEILRGNAFPDRALPAGAKTLSDLAKAVAAVRADELYRERTEGAKLPPQERKARREEADAEALAWVRTLTKEHLAAARDLVAVKVKLAEMTGKGGSLTEWLSPAAAVDSSDLPAAAE